MHTSESIHIVFMSQRPLKMKLFRQEPGLGSLKQLCGGIAKVAAVWLYLPIEQIGHCGDY